MSSSWLDLEALAFRTGRMVVPTHNDYAACILELRTRVEALEAELKEESDCNNTCTLNIAKRLRKLEAKSKPTSNPRQIRGSLVEQVALAISGIEDSSCWDDEAVNWAPEARAAIREVAAWLDTQGQHGCSLWLREELDAEQ
jgi:hypothetical protein